MSNISLALAPKNDFKVVASPPCYTKEKPHTIFSPPVLQVRRLT